MGYVGRLRRGSWSWSWSWMMHRAGKSERNQQRPREERRERRGNQGSGKEDATHPSNSPLSRNLCTPPGDTAAKARKNLRRDIERKLAEGSQKFLKAFGEVNEVRWPRHTAFSTFHVCAPLPISCPYSCWCGYMLTHCLVLCGRSLGIGWIIEIGWPAGAHHRYAHPVWRGAVTAAFDQRSLQSPPRPRGQSTRRTVRPIPYTSISISTTRIHEFYAAMRCGVWHPFPLPLPPSPLRISPN